MRITTTLGWTLLVALIAAGGPAEAGDSPVPLATDATNMIELVSFGPVEGGTAGITVMQHPSNFRYPQPVRLHPKFSYFCFAPMVLGDFSIEPGDEYVSRFRYVVHDGPLNAKLTKRLWEDFTKRYSESAE